MDMTNKFLDIRVKLEKNQLTIQKSFLVNLLKHCQTFGLA